VPIIGSGNPTGGTAGIGKGLNYVGNHAFGNSGGVTSVGGDSADTTLLSFRTGTFYISVRITWTDEWEGGDRRFHQVEINGQVVYLNSFDAQPQNDTNPLRMILPPESNVSIKWGLYNVNKLGYAVLEGRVYR